MNKNTSILSCSVDIIKEVENFKLNISKSEILSIASVIGFRSTNIFEIKKIFQSE